MFQLLQGVISVVYVAESKINHIALYSELCLTIVTLSGIARIISNNTIDILMFRYHHTCINISSTHDHHPLWSL